MIRWLIALSVFATTGCGGSAAKHVSLSTLEAETKQLGFINYMGLGGAAAGIRSVGNWPLSGPLGRDGVVHHVPFHAYS